MHPVLKLLELDCAPKHQIEHPVLLTVDLLRRSGGTFSEWEPDLKPLGPKAKDPNQ